MGPLPHSSLDRLGSGTPPRHWVIGTEIPGGSTSTDQAKIIWSQSEEEMISNSLGSQPDIYE